MSDHLQILDGLFEAPNDAARAEWLMACPMEILLREEARIRSTLAAASFEPGLEYLESFVVMMRATRGGVGIWQKFAPFHAATERLAAVIEAAVADLMIREIEAAGRVQ